MIRFSSLLITVKECIPSIWSVKVLVPKYLVSDSDQLINVSSAAWDHHQQSLLVQHTTPCVLILCISLTRHSFIKMMQIQMILNSISMTTSRNSLYWWSSLPKLLMDIHWLTNNRIKVKLARGNWVKHSLLSWFNYEKYQQQSFWPWYCWQALYTFSTC